MIFRLNFSPLAAFLASLVWTAVNFEKLINKRRKIQKIRKLPDSYLLEKVMDTSGVIGYFYKYWLPIVRLGKKVSTEKIL